MYKLTWVSLDQKFCNQLDHILITRKKQSSVKDVRKLRESNADFDHCYGETKN